MGYKPDGKCLDSGVYRPESKKNSNWKKISKVPNFFGNKHDLLLHLRRTDFHGIMDEKTQN